MGLALREEDQVALGIVDREGTVRERLHNLDRVIRHHLLQRGGIPGPKDHRLHAGWWCRRGEWAQRDRLQIVDEVHVAVTRLGLLQSKDLGIKGIRSSR